MTKAKKGGKGKAFGLTELAQLCDESRKPGLVAEDFEKQEKGRPAYDFVSGALGGASAATVVAALQRLWLHQLGLETKLLSTAAAHLRDVFQNPEEVVKQLHTWFVQNPDGKLSIGIDLLYEQVIEVYGQRDPARSRWIHLARDPVKPQWDVRGPLKLDDVVSGAWGSGTHVRVQLGASPFKGDAASASLARLLLHQSSRAAAEAADPTEWQRHGMTLCGGTLGQWGEKPDLAFNTMATTPSARPRAHVSERELAEKLANLMNDAVWAAYTRIIARSLHEDEVADDLRAAMKLAWVEWRAALDPSPKHRATFLRSMLATADEWTRTGFDVAVRTGRLRAEELARSTMVALAVAATLKDCSVSVTLGASGVDNLILGTVPAHVIALAAASHPTERTPSRLCDAPRAMLEKENGIAILGSVGEAADELFAVARSEGVPFHASDDAAQNYLHPGDPFPILTAGPLLRAAMKKGLAATKAHLAETLGHMNDTRVSGLRQAIQEAPDGG